MHGATIKIIYTKAYDYFYFEASWMVTDNLVPELSGHLFSAARYYQCVSSAILSTCQQHHIIHVSAAPYYPHASSTILSTCQQHNIIYVSAARYYPCVSSTTICTQVNVSDLHTCYSPLLSHRPFEDGPIGWKYAAQSTVGCHPHLFGSCVDFRLHEYYLPGHRCNNVTWKTIILVTSQPNWGPDHINYAALLVPSG